MRNRVFLPLPGGGRPWGALVGEPGVKGPDPPVIRLPEMGGAGGRKPARASAARLAGRRGVGVAKRRARKPKYFERKAKRGGRPMGGTAYRRLIMGKARGSRATREKTSQKTPEQRLPF